ncbi:MAG: hypothetical protein JWN53_902 [Gemmatimonadetes bacterium]|jgi:hypothetical protein|nr:hypothetical protein [Gemmatimonadota bacterium]
MAMSQNYATHRRWFPLFHYVALPILVANVTIAVAHLVRRPTLWNGWLVVLSIGLVAGLVASRTSALMVQNRLIGLEMRLRLAATLSPEMRARIPELRLRQLIALRFAGDQELPGLVERCLHGELATADAVKRAIRDWRPDLARA